MSDENPRVKWATRVEMAELAEAIGIDSDLVISATERDYGLLVMWTRSGEPEEEIMGSVLRRDDDGIYRVVKTGTTGQRLKDWIDAINQKMGERRKAGEP